MNIKIDLNITLPGSFIQALANLTGHAAAPAAPAKAPEAEKAATPVAAPVAKAPPVEQATGPVLLPTVTDDQIVAAANAAMVKFGSSPKVVKDAVAAHFQKEDGTPGTLMTTRKDQRPLLHAFLVALGETGDVAAAAAQVGR